MDILISNMHIIQPKVIVCFGQHPAFVMRSIISDVELYIEDINRVASFSPDKLSNVLSTDGRPTEVMFLPHPGAINRNLDFYLPMYEAVFNKLGRFVALVENDDEDDDEDDYA